MQHSETKDKSIKNAPTPQEIRRRAFEIHIERGGIHGCDLDDWLQAEHELRQQQEQRRGFKEEMTGISRGSWTL